jgi:hypothetical protein
LYLPKLLFLLDLQLRVKRIVFKLELYWATNSELLFDRKMQAFKEFMEAHCAPIFAASSKCTSLVELLDHLDQIETLVEAFSSEVTHFYLI